MLSMLSLIGGCTLPFYKVLWSDRKLKLQSTQPLCVTPAGKSAREGAYSLCRDGRSGEKMLELVTKARETQLL